MSSYQLNKFANALLVLITTVVFWGACAAADTVEDGWDKIPPDATNQPYLFALPDIEGPVVVSASFELRDINEINDETETFEFTGVLTLSWRDPRQVFNPASEGIMEKVFTGEYQFNEISPGWYPQVILVNQTGALEKSGVVLRVQPDGTSILTETWNAVAESEFRMRRFPFDQHRLEAVFEVLAFEDHEVQLKVEPGSIKSMYGEAKVPQWKLNNIDTLVRAYAETNMDDGATSSAFVVSIDVERKSFYMMRLVVLPLIFIVLLSFSVFWMERSSLGDRISVSFIGILTAVSYQIVMGDSIPHIAYFTLMHSVLYFSFLTMCATVVVNLVVGALDSKGQPILGDLIDRRCRWIFPLTYFGVLLLNFGIAFVVF